MKAIYFDARGAANAKLLAKLPAAKANTVTWNPAKLGYDVDTKGETTYGTTSNGND